MVVQDIQTKTKHKRDKNERKENWYKHQKEIIKRNKWNKDKKIKYRIKQRNVKTKRMKRSVDRKNKKKIISNDVWKI